MVAAASGNQRDRNHCGRRAAFNHQRLLRRLGFVPLLVIDEVGYIAFDPEAANLMFSLVSARYERASLIVTSELPFIGPARSPGAGGGDRAPVP